MWFLSLQKNQPVILYPLHWNAMLERSETLFKQYEGLRRSTLQTNNTNGVVLNKTYWYGLKLNLELISINVV